MSDLRLTEHFIIFDVFVGTYGDHSLTSLAKRRSVLRNFLLSIKRCLTIRLVTLLLNLTACLAIKTW